MKNQLFICVLVIFYSTSFFAQDRIFTNTYQSGVLGKNQKEIEVWTDVSTGRDNYYRNITNRLEFEIGLGRNLQTAFYLNTKQIANFDDITGEIVINPFEIGFSNEWKYKISNSAGKGIGSAVYLEYGFSPDEFELETKLILDKRIGNSTHAFNATYEPEWETTTQNGKRKINKKIKYSFNYAYSYQINPHFNLGFEAVNRNMNATNERNSALFLGPVISYNTDKFWVNLSVLPQVSGLTNSGLNLTEYSKLETRLIFSFMIN